MASDTTNREQSGAADQVKAVMRQMACRPVAFQPILAKITGSVPAGLMLSQALYWLDVVERTNSDAHGEFFKSQNEWQDEICLTAHEQRVARAELAKRGFMLSKVKGIPPRVFYRVDSDAVAEAILQFCEIHGIDSVKSAGSISRKSQKQTSENRKVLKEAETTSETTSEIKTLAPPAAAPALVLAPPDQSEQPDPRYEAVVEAITRYWPEHAPMIFDEADCAAVKRMLKKRPQVSGDDLAVCVGFRFLSEVNRTESVKAWIGALTDYLGGPLNRYRRPKRVLSIDDLRSRVLANVFPNRWTVAAQPAAPQQSAEQLREAFVQANSNGHGELGAMAWAAVQAYTQKHVNPRSWETWIKPCRYLCLDAAGVLFVQAPTAEFAEQAEKYRSTMQEALATIQGAGVVAVQFRNF